MALDDNSPIVEAFCQLGNKPFTLYDIGENPTLEHLETVIPEELRPLGPWNTFCAQCTPQKAPSTLLT